MDEEKFERLLHIVTEHTAALEALVIRSEERIDSINEVIGRMADTTATAVDVTKMFMEEYSKRIEMLAADRDESRRQNAALLDLLHKLTANGREHNIKIDNNF